MPALLVTVTPAAETATDTAAKAADAAAAAAMPARIWELTKIKVTIGSRKDGFYDVVLLHNFDLGTLLTANKTCH